MILIALSALMTAAANLLLRSGVRAAGGFGLGTGTLADQVLNLLRQPAFDVGAILYGAAAFTWFAVVGIEDLSVSYPVLVSLVFLLVNAGAVFFFGESISWVKAAGMAVILAGVVIVSRA